MSRSSACFGLLLTLWLASGIALADSLSELPVAWQGRLLPLPEQDLSALENSVRQRIEKVRNALDVMLRDPAAEHDEIAEAWGKLGALSQVYLMHTAARIAFENAHRLQPNDFRWAYYLAWVELSLGDNQRALDLFGKAQKLRPDYAPLILRRAEALRGLERLDEARQLYLQALKRPGLKAAASAGLAQIALLQRDFQLAARLFRQALKIDPAADGLHYPLAQALLQLGQRRQARAWLAKPGSAPPRVDDPLIGELTALHHDARQYFHQAMLALRKQDYARSVERFEQGIAAGGDNPRAAISLARTRYLAGDKTGARAGLEAVVARHPDQALAWFLLGVLDDAEGREQQALARYRKTLALEPGHEGATLFLARALFRRKDYAGAAKYFDRLTSRNVEQAPVWLFDLVSHIGMREDSRVIRRRLETAVRKFPENPVFRSLLVPLLAASGNSQDRKRALALAEALAAARPIPPVHDLLARALAANGRFDDAAAYQQGIVDFARKRKTDNRQLVALESVLEAYHEHRSPPVAGMRAEAFSIPPVEPGAVFRNYQAARPY